MLMVVVIKMLMCLGDKDVDGSCGDKDVDVFR